MKHIPSVTVTLGRSGTDLADGWTPPLEVHQLVLESGYDPCEVVEEIADWFAWRVIPVSEAA